MQKAPNILHGLFVAAASAAAVAAASPAAADWPAVTSSLPESAHNSSPTPGPELKCATVTTHYPTMDVTSAPLPAEQAAKWAEAMDRNIWSKAGRITSTTKPAPCPQP